MVGAYGRGELVVSSALRRVVKSPQNRGVVARNVRRNAVRPSRDIPRLNVMSI